MCLYITPYNSLALFKIKKEDIVTPVHNNRCFSVLIKFDVD